MAREVWRASGGGAGQKEMKLHPLRVCFCWAVPALILTLLCLSGGQAGRASSEFYARVYNGVPVHRQKNELV